MSIDSIGFSPWETLPSNTMFRVTLAAKDYFVTQSFPAAAKDIYAKLFPVAGLIPSTTLNLLSSDRSAVVDGIIHTDQNGATFLNKLESLGGLSAFVSRVERLSPNAKAKSNTTAGAEERAKAAAAQAAAADSGLWYKQLQAQLGNLGTAAKWTLIVVGLVAVAYLAHEFHHGRKR